MKEKIKFQGIIRIRSIPVEWTSAQYKRYWSKLSERARDRYTVHEARNLLTTAGRTAILTFISGTAGYSYGFAQYFSIGTQALIDVYAGDTSVAGEIFRVAPSGLVFTGTQVDIQSQIGSTQAVGTLTNAGLFGGAASATLGTGTLNTHALLNSFPKQSGQAYSVDYLCNVT